MSQRERAAGSLPTPGPVGRAARFVLGVVTAAVFAAVVSAHVATPPGSDIPTWLFFVAVLLAFRLVGDIVELSLRRPWGSATRAVAAAGIAAGVVADVAVYGRWWAPPLAWYLFLLVEVTFGFLAVSFLAAAVLAAPG